MSDPSPADGVPRARLRNVVISGASGALGRSVARRFEAAGCRLTLPTRAAEAALREAFPAARVVRAAVSDPTDARRTVHEAEAAFGPLDAVVNVAGGFATGSALVLSEDDLEAQLTTNLRTAVGLTGAALPGMARRGRGAVVAVSAGAARHGGPRLAAYAASKAALEGYLRSVRAEVEGQGLTVSLLVPEGTIDTPANRRAMPSADRARWILPEALAEAAWYLATRRPGGRVAELRVTA